MSVARVRIDKREPKDEPQLLIQPCDCGDSACDKFIVAMLRPVIVPVEGTDELASMLHCPIVHAQSIVDLIRGFAAKRGITIV